MSSTSANRFRPNYTVLPGEILMDALAERGLTQSELAIRTARPVKTINEIIQGKTSITSDTALQLERVLSIPARFWLNLESNHQSFLANEKEKERLAKYTDWLKEIPVLAMIKSGWIEKCSDPISQLQEVLSFFGIVSPEVWNQQWLSPKVSYRTSETFEKEPGATSAWLRRGEVLAQRIECTPYDAKALRDAIIDIRGLTVDFKVDAKAEIVKKCASCGVAVVYVNGLPKAPISGASRWLTPHKALIQLSLRHKTDDHFWFTFYHEVGHILLHGKKDVFLDDNFVENKDLKEHEANAFACDILMPPQYLDNFISQQKFDRARIVAFAKEIGIAPGIVVGKLQRHKLIDYSQHNDLKRFIE